MSEREGQAKVLRSKVEQVEREKRELQMRISQSSQGGMAVFHAQELQRQLDIARQQLAHKEQEVHACPAPCLESVAAVLRLSCSPASAGGSAETRARAVGPITFIRIVLLSDLTVHVGQPLQASTVIAVSPANAGR